MYVLFCDVQIYLMKENAWIDYKHVLLDFKPEKRSILKKYQHAQNFWYRIVYAVRNYTYNVMKYEYMYIIVSINRKLFKYVKFVTYLILKVCMRSLITDIKRLLLYYDFI